jgi:hypothetical protein
MKLLENFYSLILTHFNVYLKNIDRLLIEHNKHNIIPWDKSILSSSYLHINVLNDIKTHMKVSFKYLYTFDNTYINLTILYDKYNDQRTKYLIFMLNYFVYLLNRLNPVSGSGTRRINLTLINSKLRKIKPKNNNILTSENINTGLTLSTNDLEGEIIVYREEEMTKVLIHELIHFYNLDADYISSNAEHDLNMFFRLINSSIKVNESYTDTLACMINIALYSILEEKGSYIKFRSNLVNETRFIIDQAYNVLDYNGYIIDNHVLKRKCLSSDIVKCHNSESTHVISYYVLKASNFNNLNKFLEYINKYNYKLLNTTEYINLLKKNISKLIKKLNKNGKTIDSLRMTSLDIENLNIMNLMKK